MASYVVPQVEIHQLFSEIPAALAQNQVPFVFGPNYLLHRYGAESEKAGTYVGEYDSREQPGYRAGEDEASSSDSADDSSLKVKYFYPYPQVLDQTQVDKTYTKVFADNVVVSLAETTGVATVAGKPNELDIQVDAELAMEFTKGRKLRLYCLDGEVASSDSDPEITYSEKIDVTIVDIDPDNSTAEKLRIMIDEELDSGVVIGKAVLCEVQNG